MTRSYLFQAVALVLALVFPALARADAGAAPPLTHSNSTIALLAVDADTRGNTATSVPTIDGCAPMQVGSQYAVDYVVGAIPSDRPIIGFEVEIRYDANLLEAVGVDHALLLAAAGAYSPLTGLTDALPDNDGELRISVLDTASSTEPEANVEIGPGVLARVTFRAKAAGVSKIAIGLESDPLLYPLVLDTRDEMILADKIANASLAIGQDCPPEAREPEIVDLGPTNQEILESNPNLQPPDIAGGTPQQSGGTGATGTARGPSTGQTPNRSSTPARTGGSPQSTNGDDGSSDAAIIAAIVALVVLAGAVAAGGWYLYQRNRRASGSE
jgi:hypothetical protein